MQDGTSPARITGAKGKLHVAMPLRGGRYSPAEPEAVCA